LKGPSCDLAAVTEALLDAEQGGLRGRDIVRSMKEVSRSRVETSCELKQALDHAVKMVANEIHHRAQLTLQVPELPSVGIGQTKLVQLFLNLLLNAVQAFEGSEIESPHIRVEASVQRERVVVV